LLRVALRQKVARSVTPVEVFTRSMPEVARCNTIEVSEAVVRPGSKIEACDQVEQALIGTIRDRDRQRFLVKSFGIAADDVSQQPTQGPLLGRASPLKVASFCWKMWKVRKP
jgi:hypothetical protein